MPDSDDEDAEGRRIRASATFDPIDLNEAGA
jgi:hypothetical protein